MEEGAVAAEMEGSIFVLRDCKGLVRPLTSHTKVDNREVPTATRLESGLIARHNCNESV